MTKHLATLPDYVSEDYELVPVTSLLNFGFNDSLKVAHFGLLRYVDKLLCVSYDRYAVRCGIPLDKVKVGHFGSDDYYLGHSSLLKKDFVVRGSDLLKYCEEKGND